jgi:hypothetical protein
MAKVERIMIAWFLITLLVGLGIGYSFTYLIYQPQIQTLQNGLNGISENLNVLTANTNAFLEAINSTLQGIKLTLGATNSTFEGIQSTLGAINSTLQLPTHYYWFSGVTSPIQLNAYPANDSWIYRDFTIEGYRQVSVYIGSMDNQEDQLAVRIGMGDFSGIVHPGGYMWATYYNITEMKGFNPVLQSTLAVQGPQLSIEVYNLKQYSAIIKIAVYVTR